MDYEAVIGLEVHAQLTTCSKIFTPSSTEFGHGVNELTDPVTLGMPGCLPVLNKKVVEYAIMLGLATDCQIRKRNRFARKHYFYPDLPKGYQISQYEEPICEHGNIKVRFDDTVRSIGITRIHMEEDAGKNIHDPRSGTSLVDLNRAGVPLLEIVSEPDLRTPAEASAYLKTMRKILRFLEICDGNMEEGSMRCDANVSVRPVGETKFGTRTELKNINSFKFVEKALEYEIARQIAVIKAGDVVIQETRLFDSETGTTHAMRSKEESADYRYFPDPDLPELKIQKSLIEAVRDSMPVLPEEARTKLIEVYGLSEYDADVITAERLFVDYFEEAFQICSNAKATANWLTSELFGYLNKEAIRFEDCKVSARDLGTLIKLIETDVLSGKMAKVVFEEMFNTGKSPEQIVEEQGLKQITDPEEIRKTVTSVIDENPTQLEQYLGGNDKLFGFFVGQTMKKSGGSMNPKVVNEILKDELEKRKG
ncbi:MAG: Asp-tRNA(Asn)/Glu-tRNA(Gln) amidotransferase subunit GatB [Deltaproteobacteria bacterium]|nr:Asp-tRNA(Asn)/Glu-tRNA(Gln) amidotransferase subunit GatB [Deltaproteobacteria bacterium]